VFERADRIGGLLMYGIPNMKLDKQNVVERRIELMERKASRFALQQRSRRGRTIGRNCSTEFDAVVLCTGATKPRDLPIEGRELKGVHFAMEFLTRQHQGACSTRPPQRRLHLRRRART
jgi:glutamate synthase (NADPH/NADH) small chain